VALRNLETHKIATGGRVEPAVTLSSRLHPGGPYRLTCPEAPEPAGAGTTPLGWSGALFINLSNSFKIF
jgi:hypothetical protein